VARLEHPGLDVEHELARLDRLATRSRAGGGRADEALARLREFLFDEEAFRGNAENYYDPRNSCLNDVLDRKLGIPITLSLVMMEVGRRVGLDIAGVGLPGHFIVGVALRGRRVFLDPFHGGRELTADAARDVVSRAVGRPVKLEPSHWTPCTKPQILVRMLRNLKTIYARQAQWERALAVVDRLLVLEADSPTHRRDRGTVLVRLGRLWEGAVEWERYLTAHPGVHDADTFRQELRRVRQELGSRN
jgi:regulator of sirC expression with transglutaminase-like and TPR domain